MLPQESDSSTNWLPLVLRDLAHIRNLVFGIKLGVDVVSGGSLLSYNEWTLTRPEIPYVRGILSYVIGSLSR
jgi:hypothetical protein